MKVTTRQCRLDVLKNREAEGTLTQQERSELDAIFAEIDAEEAAALKPAMEKYQAQNVKLLDEKVELETTVAHLQTIVAAQKQLLDDARSYLAQLRVKRAMLAEEYHRVTGHDLTGIH